MTAGNVGPRRPRPRPTAPRAGATQAPTTRSAATSTSRTSTSRTTTATNRPATNRTARIRSGSSRPAPRQVRSRFRFRVVLVAVCILASLYAGRLFEIQALDASALASSALDERLRNNTVLAERGEILDRDGDVLASTAGMRDITVDQRLVATYQDPDDPRRAGPRAAADRLAPVIGMDVETVAQALTGDAPFGFVARDISPEVWRKVVDLRVVGIFSVETSRRTYPAGSVAAGIVGHVDAEGIGAGGLERAMQETLAGEDGWSRFEVSGESRAARPIPGGAAEELAPVDGQDVQLTIDRDLQWQAESAAAEAVAQSGAQSASVVVQDVRTGELLALATVPSFDPNDPGAANPADLGNRAVSEVFEPGSTSKVITIAAALEEGVVEPGTQFSVADSIERGGTTFGDSHPHPVQQLTVAGILAESSNVGTILAAEQMDNDTLHAWFRAFGYGERTGIELPGETPGLLAAPEDWSGSQRYTVMFGQGVSVNALQVSSVFQTIANDGVSIAPTVVTGTRSADGRLLPEPTGRAERVLSEETATTMQSILESAVGEGGTGGNAVVDGYRVAGKTGTAQRYDDTCGGYCGYTASFAGFAPADDPSVVVSVSVQDPVRGYYGGTTAAPVFQKVMSAALASQAVPASGQVHTPLPLTW